jgi:hypothetical protein
MKKKFWKKFTIVSISLIFFSSVVTTLLWACAGGDMEDYVDSFFAPELIHEEKFQPFFTSPNTFYNQGFKEDYNQIFDTTNINEWKGFFEQKVNEADLNYLLYKSRLGEIDTLIFYTRDTKYPIKTYLKNNSLNDFSDKGKVKEFLYYIGFAKRCEKHAVKNIYYWDEPKVDPSVEQKNIGDLIKGGLKQIKTVHNTFIKERYYFQLTRLYFFAQNYNECSSYFNQHIDSFVTSSSMKYRSMSYAAGARARMGQPAEANYMFAQVYDQSDALKETAYLSFSPVGESDWNGSLALAKNPREKTAVWHMLGITQDPLRAMENIYNIDPKSDLLDLLLVRAINNMESDVVSVNYYSTSDTTTFKLNTSKLDPNLVLFIGKVALKENTLKPYLWNLAASYVYTLAKDYKKANAFLTKAKTQTKQDKLAQEQIRITEIMAKVDQYVVSEKNEESIVPDLEWLKNTESHDPNLRTSDVYNWTLHRLSKMYYDKGDWIKALCLNSSIDLTYLDDNNRLDQMIAYLDKATKTNFDKAIINLYPYKQHTLYDMQGVNLLYDNKLKEAGEKFIKAGPKEMESNPFTIRIKDCRDCDQAVYDGSYTSVKFVDEMLALEDKVKTDPNNAFKYYYKMANGYYNMTYFGNCRNLYMNEAFNPGLIYFEYGEATPHKKYLDCSRSLEYYLKALNATTDKERKAVCTFMAAKCEQNEYFITRQNEDGVDFKAGKYFKDLKTQYASTNYYKEVLKECGYFRTYVNNK